MIEWSVTLFCFAVCFLVGANGGERGIHERTFVLVSGSTSHMRDIAVGYIEGVKMGQLEEKRQTRRAVQGCTSRRRSGPGTRGRTFDFGVYVEFGA